MTGARVAWNSYFSYTTGKEHASISSIFLSRLGLAWHRESKEQHREIPADSCIRETRIDGWYAGMDLPGTRQMMLLKRFFLDIPWHSLTPRCSDPAWAQFTDREESVLATCGQDLFVAYFYGPSRSPGTLRNLDPGVSYRADCFDPRTGTWTPIGTDLRADKGQWKIPMRPDGDWVLVIRVRATADAAANPPT